MHYYGNSSPQLTQKALGEFYDMLTVYQSLFCEKSYATVQ